MIRIHDVTKEYKTKKNSSVKAINHLNLDIEEGTILGLLGPNGAGKSTLIKMILGVLHPTQGRVYINGKEAFSCRKSLMKDIGIVFGQRSQLWWDLPANDTYKLLCKIYGMEETLFNEWLNEIITRLDAKEIVNKPVRFLSLGQRVRCEIIAALCFQPSIIILDEPTIGLDISVKEKIREFLVYLNKEKKVTIILTTHDLSDIEAICDRIIVLNHGVVLYDDTSKRIRETNSNKKCEIVYSMGNNKDMFPFDADIEYLNNKQFIRFNGETTDIMSVIHWCNEHGEIEDVNITGPTIEDIVKNFY